MKNIKWLTEKQVARAAKRGRKAALLCSIKHWEQLSSANKGEIIALSGDYIKCNFCALCTKYDFARRPDACSDCGLHCLKGHKTRAAAWRKAANAFSDFRDCLFPLSNWEKWKQASKALLRKIIKLYESEYGAYCA